MASLHALTPDRCGWVLLGKKSEKDTPSIKRKNKYRELCLSHLGPEAKVAVKEKGESQCYFARIHMHPEVQALGVKYPSGIFKFPTIVPVEVAREIEAATNDGSLPEFKFTDRDLAGDVDGYLSVPNFTRAHAEQELRQARLVAGLTPSLPPQPPRVRGAQKSPAGTKAKLRYEAEMQRITDTNPPNAEELKTKLTKKYESEANRVKTRVKLIAKATAEERHTGASSASSPALAPGPARSSRRVRVREREDRAEAAYLGESSKGSKRRRVDVPSSFAQLGLPKGSTIFSPELTTDERLDAAHVIVENAPESAIESIMAAAETIAVLQHKLKSQERRMEAVRVRDQTQEEAMNIELKKCEDKHVYDMGRHGGLCRFNLTNKAWHDTHVLSAKHLFGFKTWDETVRQLIEWFPELKEPKHAHPREMKQITEFEKCLVTRMRMRRGTGMTAEVIALMFNRRASSVGRFFEVWLPRLSVHPNCAADRFTLGKGENSKK